MTARIAAAVLVLTFAALAQTVPSPTDKPVPPVGDKSAGATKLAPGLLKTFGNYGGWWNNSTEAEKDAFIDGFTAAMARANSVANGVAEATLKNIKPNSACTESAYEVMDLRLLGQTFSFNLDKPLKPRLDEFYKDPLNFRIPIQLAMDHVRDEMSGQKTPGQLLDELDNWRKIVNQ